MKLKVVSLNLYQGYALDAAVAFLDQEQPDVVTLQEVYNGTDPTLSDGPRSLSELLRRLSYTAHDFEAAFIEDHEEGLIPEGNAILSRFPIISRDAVFFDEPFNASFVNMSANSPRQPHVLQHVLLQTPAGAMDVFNIHGPWDLDGDNDSPKRRQMVAAIQNGIKGKDKVIVAGDTNAKPTNKAMKPLEDKLVSVFGTELQSTFNMLRKDNPGYATAAVDMMFVTPNIKVLSKDCPTVDISDHLPLVVTLEIK